MIVLPGDTFGVIDIVYNDQTSRMDEDDANPINSQKTQLRKFTAQCIEKVEYLTLSMDALDCMKIEFSEIYEELFADNQSFINNVFLLKLRALLIMEAKERNEQFLQNDYNVNPNDLDNSQKNANDQK